MSNRYTEKMAQKICDAWNEKIPVGSEVEYEEVIHHSGPFIATTRSAAWIVCGQPMVMIEGKAGGVSIDHMTGWHEPKRHVVNANRVKNGQAIK